MRLPPLEPYGRAMLAYHLGNHQAKLDVRHSLDGTCELTADIFFRQPDEFYDFEIAALAHTRGRVLDIGAGSGLHSLALQDRGLDVTAVEIVAQAVRVMRERGVRRVREGDVFQLELPVADTIILLMNGTGLAQTREGLERLLARLRRSVHPQGQILIDSADPGPPSAPDCHPGEAIIELGYDGEWGEPYGELYCDFGTLDAIASKAGWNSQVIFCEEDGTFVARLIPE